jgi:phosphoserine phosphatase/dolichol kinase
LSTQTTTKLVAFDVEGILIPKMRFMLFEVAGRIGLKAFIRAAFIGMLYEIGLISVKTALTKLYKPLKGLPFEQFISWFQKVPLMPGVEEIFRKLKQGGFKTALISSGIPTAVLEKLAERLGADYVAGLEIGLSEGLLTGKVWGDVLESDGKATALRKILSDNALSPCCCIGVADDRNNLPMFKLCDLKIGYNPDFVLSYKSDYAVKGDLSVILSIIKGEDARIKKSKLAKSTLIREAIHTTGFLVPLVCAYLLSRYIIALLIFLVAVIYLISETERIYGHSIPVFTSIIMSAAGSSEVQEFVVAPIFYALGIALSLTLFPEPVCYVAVTVLTLGDGFAAVFGRRFGRTRVPFNKVKNFEGTAMGFLFALLGSLVFVEPIKALIASAVGMVVEVLPLPLNDNLTIPLVSGLALIMCSMFLPV